MEERRGGERECEAREVGLRQRRRRRALLLCASAAAPIDDGEATPRVAFIRRHASLLRAPRCRDSVRLRLTARFACIELLHAALRERDALAGRDQRAQRHQREREGHHAEQAAEHEDHDALGALEEPALEVAQHRLRARLRVGHHHAGDQRECREPGERRVAAACVVHQQAEQQRHVDDAVEARIEEAAEARRATLAARNHAVDEVEHAAEHHDPRARAAAALPRRRGLRRARRRARPATGRSGGRAGGTGTAGRARCARRSPARSAPSARLER